MRSRWGCGGVGWMAGGGVAILAAAAVLLAGGRAEPAPPGAAPRAFTALPASLDACYPPVAPKPVYLLEMLGLQDALSGIVVDLLEGEPEGARAGLAAFTERYRHVAGLVPEWRDEFPGAPVEALEKALAGDDPGAAMGALDAVGGVCHACHVRAMAPVELRYRWGRFDGKVVSDPLAGDESPYAAFKRRLATNLTGITHDLRQGQIENARRQFDGFDKRFSALRASCFGCHETPRRSFVDPEVQALIDDLGRALEAPVPDLEQVAGLAGRIGRASCSGCHLVHVPAAMARAAGSESHGGGR